MYDRYFRLVISSPCGYEEQFKRVVHRYNNGMRVCRCGKESFPDPEVKRQEMLKAKAEIIRERRKAPKSA